MDKLEYQTAWFGGLTINDTDAHTGNWKGFFVTSDCVITHIYVNDGSTDVQSGMISTPANGIKASALKTRRNDVITEIKLASGQVEMINEDQQG